MSCSAVAGFIAVLTLGTFVGIACAQTPPWPATTGVPLFTEWYSDLPWHQKLGTYTGNEIDEAIVLPYSALNAQQQGYCTANNLSQDRCMIETGVVNVFGTLRTDTPYTSTAAPYCNNSSFACVQVKLQFSSFWAQIDNGAVALKKVSFGTEPKYVLPVFTEGTTFAPQMPWYMSHYCDGGFPIGTKDVNDPVCYADYFSSMNSGFNSFGGGTWPTWVPWSVFPYATYSGAPSNHCKDGLTECTIVLAGFALSPVPQDSNTLQYAQYNSNLFSWFNNALQNFKSEFSDADLKRHFPWNGLPVWNQFPVMWQNFLYPQAASNPFLGQFPFQPTGEAAVPPNCDVKQSGPTDPACTQTAIVRSTPSVHPRQCSLADLVGNVDRLRQCGLNYEVHPNGWRYQWPDSFSSADLTGMLDVNQYGRTTFLFAGVPGMQMPVPFYKDPSIAGGLSVYEQVHNASIFSLYLPIANEADARNAYPGRNYTDIGFYHTLLMSNHMESDPSTFADGIRGKVLWHDEYRTQQMYNQFATKKNPKFSDITFAAAFKADTAPAPFHNNTCDGCHVRNGSGIPINTGGTLDPALQGFMANTTYTPYFAGKDYTFTGQIRPMKLVFFDLQQNVTQRPNDSVYAEPLSFLATLTLLSQTPNVLYNNKIMNFYGDSFHVTRPGYNYKWQYTAANTNQMVVKSQRFNKELGIPYQPMQVQLGPFQTPSSCAITKTPPPSPKLEQVWPLSCSEIGGPAIGNAINNGTVGFMLLNGKRLGNLGAIDAIPNAAIVGFQQSQQGTIGNHGEAGEILWNAGSRDGVVQGTVKPCNTTPKSLTNCFIGRYGWLGDRVSLEDQVANAAYVEMNMTTTQGFNALPSGMKTLFPIRYNHPNCGPADATCVASKGNADLSEQDINRMADYARWLGIPTRSEFTVSLPDVIAGEKIFNQIQCNTCHVISKIDITDENDTMLTQVFRNRLKTRIAPPVYPFLSYIGTDLLMHDMGYLSLVGTPPAGATIRDQYDVVMPAYHNFVQKIRTPALKGLRFNRFVTDSHRNTKHPLAPENGQPSDPACDFLLHDGRACDAIEAAFLHDGPAIKKLGVIDMLNGLSKDQLRQLRAFLYSL